MGGWEGDREAGSPGLWDGGYGTGEDREKPL